MSQWHSKDVGDGVEAFGPSGQLFDAYETLAIGGGSTKNAAVFSAYDLRRNVVTWWFTPGAAQLAKAFGASPTSKPTPAKGFGLLVGDMNAWEAYFPGYLSKRDS